MTGTALFWIATAVLITEGIFGPFTAVWVIVGVSVAAVMVARQAAATRRGRQVPSP